jgi:hypothetical protein
VERLLNTNFNVKKKEKANLTLVQIVFITSKPFYIYIKKSQDKKG